MQQRSVPRIKAVKILLRIREKDRKLSYNEYLEELSLPEEFKQLARKKNK